MNPRLRKDEITVEYQEKDGGVLWTASSNGHPIATGWELEIAQARRQGLSIGVENVVRWLNPQGISGVDLLKRESDGED